MLESIYYKSIKKGKNMSNQEIDIEALKTNKDFLANLVLLEEEMNEQNSIEKGYQLLDALLLISEDEDKINDIFTFILKEAFDKLAEYLSQQKGFDMNVQEDLFTARAIYEHAIERYSDNDIKGSKELFQVLHYMIDEKNLKNAMMVHAVSVMKGNDFDTFIGTIADIDKYEENDKLAYFLKSFKIDTDKFLSDNADLVQQAKDELKVLEESK
ncbi:hypothetical protein MNB_SV-9-1454 [hydrothermal vent metagenome]|uniref:Uncharacterized protein n=1 Tax=hydrothermal vent metagenome TaxID=652676 RepID=A0A1W1C6P5_9ZZZZ